MLKKINPISENSTQKINDDKNINPVNEAQSQANISPLNSFSKSLSLKTKVTIFTTIISALPLLVIGGAVYVLVHQFLSEDATKLQKAKVNSIAVDVKSYVLERKEELESLAEQDFLANAENKNITKIQDRLKNWKTNHNYYDDIALVDINGNVLTQTQDKVLGNQKTDSYFQSVINTNKSFISQPVIATETASKEAKIVLAVPIKNYASGKIDGIIKTELPGKSISKMLNQPPIKEGKYYLIDGTNKIFLASDTNVIGKEAKDVFNNWEKLKVNSLIIKDELTAYAPWQEAENIPNLKWQFVSSINKNIAFGMQQQLLLILGLGLLITVLLASGIAASIANRLIARLISANDALKQLAKGKLETRLTVKGKDELTSLDLNINEMAQQLEELLLRQKKEAEQLRQFSHTFMSIRQSRNIGCLLETTVKQVRQALDVERVVIYSYTDENHGNVLAESCGSNFVSSQKLTIPNIYTAKNTDNYISDHILAVNSFNDLNLESEDLYLIEELEVKACLIASIFKDNQNFGFLIVHDCVAPRIWQPQEMNFIRQLAIQIGGSLERISLLEDAQSLKNLAIHLSNSWNTEEIYNLAVQDIRQGLKADRVVIYQFDEDWHGKIIAESVVAGFPCAMGVKLYEPCLVDYVEKYKLGSVQATNDVYQASFGKCYLQQLEAFAIKANLVAPIIVGEKLLGLLIAHQCSQPRNWQKSEIELFEQFSRLVGLALERANIIATAKKSCYSAENFLENQQQQQGELREQLALILSQVESVNYGNLTVQAEASNPDVTAIAQLFNVIVEKLRNIVVQVQNYTTDISTIMGENSRIVDENLQLNSTQHLDYLHQSWNAIAQMRNSIKTVVKSAKETTEITQHISKTAAASSSAIDATCHNIVKLHDTIGDMTQKIKRLGEASQKISQVISIINSVTTQTNLLAINAGIEATRNNSGNHGFSVVVEEIEILANRSASSASEIEFILANIQRETSELTQAMELEYQELTQGTRSIEETKVNLTEILNFCHQIDTLASSMSLATVSQVKLSQEVKHNLTEAVKIAELTKVQSEHVSDSFKKAVDISEQLRGSMEDFKVS
ncbi:GAF domain-containing protein [Calothrix sp. PCC 6303]|uniref:GAF domain-containing protein n=1 Tax=Calothrix sp. PCC 6303 TaxID=1170562 RepID=UPI0002A02C12|nr:GAF domain-containing protein [Calothrix sp. PCC 6303]AFZ03019.1 methyl-accepting chemotaxis sensory transducer with GAF sensor [Calothrix sp. PCC 6303]